MGREPGDGLDAPTNSALKPDRMQRLILMRHAEAERAPPPGVDRDRALSDRGRADAALMGRALAAKGLRPDLALVSPRPHAQTWECCMTFGDVEVRETSPSTTAPPTVMRRFIEGAEEQAGCLLVVAHNPGVHMLAVEYLIESAASPSVTGPDEPAASRPAAAALFEVDVAGRCTYRRLPGPQPSATARHDREFAYKLVDRCDRVGWPSAPPGPMPARRSICRRLHPHVSAPQLAGTARRHYAGRKTCCW
jgi:phosphohistidine phosphatase